MDKLVDQRARSVPGRFIRHEDGGFADDDLFNLRDQQRQHHVHGMVEEERRAEMRCATPSLPMKDQRVVEQRPVLITHLRRGTICRKRKRSERDIMIGHGALILDGERMARTAEQRGLASERRS